MTRKVHYATAILVACLLAGSAATQDTPASAPVATRPVPTIVQSPEFLALAARARLVKNVHAKGVATMEMATAEKFPEDLRKVNFEVWVTPPCAKVVIELRGGEVGVSDGGSFYKFRRLPDGKPVGRRRRITADNYYKSQDMASVFCDAANGYANLAAKVRFAPAGVPAKLAKTHAGLKWFELQPVGEPTHHLLASADVVQVGFDTGDGLIRVIVIKGVRRGEPVTATIEYKNVVHGKVKPADLKLPPEAAQAAWVDADTDKSFGAPVALIAPK